jgi:hypothetical protein
MTSCISTSKAQSSKPGKTSVNGEIVVQSPAAITDKPLTTKHFKKHNKKNPLTKPLFDPDVSDETTDIDVNQGNANKNKLENYAADVSNVDDHDEVKLKRKRFSRKLTPAPDEMLVPSGSLIESVASKLSKSDSSVFSENDEKGENSKVESENEQFSTPVGTFPTTPTSVERNTHSDDNKTVIIDSEVVELRAKPPQKPPRTYDSLIASSNQSFDSLTNLDTTDTTKSNPVGMVLQPNVDSMRACDKNSKSVPNIYSEYKDMGRKTEISTQSISIGHDVPKDSDSIEGKSGSISKLSEKTHLSSTPGSVSCIDSPFVNDQPSSGETSSIGLSQNINMGLGTDDNNLGGGSNKIEHSTGNNVNSKEMVHDGDENVLQKKEKKQKKQKKHKKKEKSENEGRKHRKGKDQISKTAHLLDRNEEGKIQQDSPSSNVEKMEKIGDNLSEKVEDLDERRKNTKIEGKKAKSMWRTLETIFKIGKTFLRTKNDGLQNHEDTSFSTSNPKCIKNGSAVTDGCPAKSTSEYCESVQICSSSSAKNVSSGVEITPSVKNAVADCSKGDGVHLNAMPTTASNNKWVDVNVQLYESLCSFNANPANNPTKGMCMASLTY